MKHGDARTRGAPTACRVLVASGAAALLAWIGVDRASSSESDWRRITAPPSLTWPRDHGAHPEVRTEWWYLTANLVDGSDRSYGAQVTFFRYGIDPSEAGPGEAPLRTRHALAAHLAIAEADSGRFRHAERVWRADGGFAGFRTDDLGVWLGDWELERKDGDLIVAGASDRVAGLAVELRFRPTKPLVRQGEEGYSRKGSDPGNASAYVSWTRLEVGGTLTLDGRKLAVAGAGWFDHEWGTSQLGEGVVGWDWLSLRLAGGSELMVYRLRRADGSPDRFSSGTLVRPDGSTRHLGVADVELTPTAWWKSPETGGEYPARWRIRLPSEDIDVEVVPLVPAAEVDGRRSTGVVYWEGPVTVSGSHGGEGYAELTGYAGSLAGRF